MNKDKVLVELSIPASGDKFDLWLPKTLSLASVIQFSSQSILNLSKQKYLPQSHSIIYLSSTGNILDKNKTPDELGFYHGIKLTLI